MDLLIKSYLASVAALCRQTEEVKGAAWKRLGPTWASHHMKSLETEGRGQGITVSSQIPLGKKVVAEALVAC